MSDAQKRLEEFIAKFEPRHQELIRAARKAMRERLPAAYELVYDNYNFFVIGYSPTKRPSDSIFSIAAAANGVGLCFVRGAGLADPKKVLQGSGRQTRFLRLPSVDVLDRPEVKALMKAAIAKARPLDGDGELIIRSVSAKQRPRRKPAAARPTASRRSARRPSRTRSTSPPSPSSAPPRRRRRASRRSRARPA